jgi:hypothetical protein
MIDKLGDPLKVYESFQFQLEDDPEMRKLGVMFGMSNQEQQEFIVDKINEIFADYGEEYVAVALHYIEFVAGMTALVKQIREQQ